MHIKHIALAATLLPLLTVCSNAQNATTSGPSFTNPTRILNPYLPLSTLKQDLLLGTTGGKRDLVERSILPNVHVTFHINGQTVPALVMQDKDYVGGKLVEVTRDYFAQSDFGTVYYLGEDVDDYTNGVITGHEGAWRYGVNTNHLGIIVPGRPKVGQKFAAENVPGITSENDEITSLTAVIKTPIGTFFNAMKITESYPDGHKEFKYYIPTIGVVTEIDPDGTVSLISHESAWQLRAPGIK